MAISSERLVELNELYAALKVRVLAVDLTYSLDYVEPQLDMPDSLNLQKLTFTAKTPAELTALATQEVQAAYVAKQRSLDSSYATKLKNYATRIAELKEKYDQKLVAASDKYEQDVANFKRKLINNGLMFSTTYVDGLANASKDYNAQNSALIEESGRYEHIIRTEQRETDSAYQQSCNSLENEKQAKIKQVYQKLFEADEKLRISIEKYNNTLEEKEQKYQASREKAYQSARNAEYTRVYNAAKIYAQMGEIGYRNVILKEKYAICQDVFYPLRREEAQAILAFDSFLRVQLDIYYSTFVDWVNTVLIPTNK